MATPATADAVVIKQEKVEPKEEPAPAPPPPAEEFSPNQKGASGVPLIEQRTHLTERLARFEQRVERDAWDVEAWTAMFVEAQSKDIEVARPIYERFLKQFPTAGRHWKYYVEHELARGNLDKVDALFSRSLLKCHNIDLWRSYIVYLRGSTKDGKERTRDDITRGFEFALEHMGLDISSTPIWSDYLGWVRSWKPMTQFEEGQKMTALRRLYTRAVENPMNNLEGIWQDYNSFEKNLNEVLVCLANIIRHL
eukprot:TRINITY_DN26778_c0_g1_i1.p1 TRINITY_DN26778_c0_g1~~TRINITY_DN26778_c0_g1_i1.p1  ORF type:complete len:252 (+),score=81.03 TRINITY_DN26778_c0_g1_i1:146-901(+)